MKFAAFDLEIAKEIPEGETDWKSHMPLGISCVALAMNNGQTTIHGKDYQAMDRDELSDFIEFMKYLRTKGYTFVGWNSLSFDFHVLAAESGRFDDCKELALNHADLMFQFFCIQGYFLGLDKAAKGCGLGGKPEGMDGAQAPKLWLAGEYDTVLNYLKNDVRMTLELAEHVAEWGEIVWTSSRGNPMVCSMGKPLMVRECLELPLPDTSWMTDPKPRSYFTEWMGGE